jgi:hypothetical protein
MTAHPTHRERTYFLDAADDDNSQMATKKTPLRHAEAIDEFTRSLTKHEVNERSRAIESFVFTASGGLEQSESYKVQELTKDWRGFEAPDGTVLLAKSELYARHTSWHLAKDGSRLTLIENFGQSSMRSADLTKEQTAELLQTLANPYLEGNPAAKPNASTSTSYFKVAHEAVQILAWKLEIDLTPKSCLENGWLRVERGAWDGDVGPHGRPFGLLLASVPSTFRGRISDDITLSLYYWGGSGMPKAGEVGLLTIATIGHDEDVLVKRVLNNNMEPCITHFRRVDEGKQVIAVDQAENGRTWNATLFSEVMGTLVVKSASFGDKEMLVKRMQQEADTVLQPTRELAREAGPQAKERGTGAGR